ncbi:nucleotidyltransferase family protein [Roseateles saccharophilus]|uniref:Putative nucleotidyltransferase-like protein n=1 Tax=Roseateles saccharophilus TaxID=304 RepID=A0A4R3UQ22_ROSSA|nr:nucleotidyltransferase family protein [Roseateles saccharophilus]TCU93112.1 putative nucleotidyltransferase-like protein [Roseateles saccharophilus]
MEKLDRPLPSDAIVEHALRVTTERLAAELAAPAARPPDWDEFEWRTAMAVCAMHGISALLAGRLRWTGPDLWQAFLAEQAEQGRMREQKTRALLQRLDDAARRAGLPLLAMKGSALLDLDLYAPGQRPMSDVDLLARPEDFPATHRLLLEAGYVEGVKIWKHVDYLPLDAPADRGFGEHATNPIKVELHTAVMERLPVREVAITPQLQAHAAPPGLNPYPSQAALMRHLLQHAAGNLCGHGIRLIHLHDLAALAPRLDERDWDDVLAIASDGLPAWWALPPLALAARIFPDAFPPAVLAHAQALAGPACPASLLRAMRGYRLDDVSLSGYRIPILPGIAWSHGAAEALTCARLRIHPGREAARQNRRAAASVHAFAGFAWTFKPRWQKALRYLLRGAPPRVPTLYSLQRALAYEPSHRNSA